MIVNRLFLGAALVLSCAGPVYAQTIDIAIGHQSMCTDTYTGGIVVKELKLLEKRPPHDGKYAGVNYNITWSDYASGGPITNQMLAGCHACGMNCTARSGSGCCWWPDSF